MLISFLHYRSWGVGPSDMKILFESVGKLCDILMNFFSEVRAIVCHYTPFYTHAYMLMYVIQTQLHIRTDEHAHMYR